MMKESNLETNWGESEITNEKMRALLDRKVMQIQMGFERKVKDLKPLLLDNACEFIKE